MPGAPGVIDDVYTRSAQIYDLVYQKVLDYAVHGRRIRELIEKHVEHPETLLEVGCGTGLYLEQFAGMYRVAGIDLSEPMLQRARRRLPEAALHRADMTSFDLGAQFDAVVCLFSSIAYVRDRAGLRSAVAAMARHLAPGGLLIVEPWFSPDRFDPQHIGAGLHEYPDIKIARFSICVVEHGCSVMDMHHMVATAAGVETFTERHVMGLFTVEDQLEAFHAAGLDVEHDPEGLIGRGLFLARHA